MTINQEPHIHKNIICANIFVRKDGKYLLLRRSNEKKYAPGVVHPLGDKVDSKENPMKSARRELLEEAGIKVKNVRLEAVLLELAPIKDDRTDWLIFHFSGDYDSGDLKTTEEGELVWLTPEEISKQKLFPSVEKVIENILNPNDGTVFATFVYDNEKNIISETRDIDGCVA